MRRSKPSASSVRPSIMRSSASVAVFGNATAWYDAGTTTGRGAFAAVRAFRPLLKATGSALVVNVSSIAGATGMGSNVAYCASKAALDNMTRLLARALAPLAELASAVVAAVTQLTFTTGAVIAVDGGRPLN